jgi:aminopeptidase N
MWITTLEDPMSRKLMAFAMVISVAMAFSLVQGVGLVGGDQKKSEQPTRKEVRAYIIKSEAASYARLGHLLQKPTVQRDYDTRYYRLDLTVDEVAQTVGGNVIMVSTSRVDGLSSVEVDLYDNMQVDSIYSAGQSISFTHTSDLITADLPAPANQGDQFFVKIYYSGTPQSSGWGSFGFDTHQGDPIIWSLSQPDNARTWWPCNDDPSDKADSADVMLTVSDDLVASSNGTLESETDNGDGTKTFHWKEHYPIPSYLISLAISNYEIITDWYVTAGGDSMPVVHYVYPETYNDALESFNVTVSMIEAMAEKFGEYPYLDEKYAHSEFPWPGAMEHQTNCSYGSWLITGNHDFDWLTAHELGHQWYGDMITCETWEDVWLNEGFATYSEAVWAEYIGGFTGYRNYMISIDNYFDGGNFPGPIYDPDQLFNETVYEKAGWALHMLRHVLGDDAFFQALWDYGHDPEFVHGTANTVEVQAFFETSSGEDLDWFFQEWIYGENRPYYEYWWLPSQVGDDFELTVNVDQIQTNAPAFRMPVDIQVVTASGETTFTVIDSLDSQGFSFTLDEEPQNVYVDRYNWILKHVRMVDPPDGIGDGDAGILVPRALALNQNYPNPFNPSTVISYEVPDALDGSEMHLTIYDLRGRKVRALSSGPAEQGRHEVAWNGRDDNGRPVGSGLFLYRLEVGGKVMTKRMVLLK